MNSEGRSKQTGVQQRSFTFALRVIKLCQTLDSLAGVARTLSWQLLRAGTSIGANLAEARSAQSRADFVNKLEVALKEARETAYWLDLLAEARIVAPGRLGDMRAEVEEITRMLAASVISTKRKRQAVNPDIRTQTSER